jgi:WD40 repeat protein
VNSLALTPDGRTAVSGGLDQTLRVWDVASGQCLRTLTGHTNWVRCVALTPEGRMAVSASDDRTLRVWDLASGDVIAVYRLESNGESVATASDNRLLIGTVSGQLHFLTLRNWPQ